MGDSRHRNFDGHTTVPELDLRKAAVAWAVWHRSVCPLGPVYGWFTEGFDTAALNEAKALLDELS